MTTPALTPKPYRLLVLTSQLPYPPHQGATIRSFNILRQLAARAEIDLLSFVTRPEEVPAAGPLQELCRRIAWDLTPQRSLFQRALTTFFSPQPDMALRFASPRFAGLVQDALRAESYHAVLGVGIDVGRYLLQIAGWRRQMAPSDRRPVLIFDDLNAEYLLQQRAFETDLRQCWRPRRAAGALYSFIQWRKLRRFEARLCRTVDHVVAVSEADRLALQRLVPGLDAVVVPNGVDLDHYSPALALPPADIPRPALVFTGKMDFRPNVDAAIWFAEEVLPRIRAEFPGAAFAIVGRDPHPLVRRLSQLPGVLVTGYVPDDRPYFSAADVYVVPLRVGGGTRLKVLSAMAMGKAIVSTSLGCEGLGVVHGRELLLGDTPEEFAGHTIRLLQDAGLRQELGRRARQFVEAHYAWSALVPRLEQLYAG
jgi:sugar transferase (PEP-CTERM/EpsH1 system associated)